MESAARERARKDHEEEKRQLQLLNLGLAEKISAMRESEATVVAKMQDAKDQAELLEFRVLELEEEQEKVRHFCSVWLSQF